MLGETFAQLFRKDAFHLIHIGQVVAGELVRQIEALQQVSFVGSPQVLYLWAEQQMDQVRPMALPTLK